MENFNSFSRRFSPKFASPEFTAVVRRVISLHIHRARAAVHPSASTPPSPCPCSPTTVIGPFPKIFTSSFPVQNPKIVVRSYLKPFTGQRTAATNKTLLGEPSPAVYKQDTKSSVTLPWEAQGLLFIKNMPGALRGQARGS